MYKLEGKKVTGISVALASYCYIDFFYFLFNIFTSSYYLQTWNRLEAHPG